MSANAQDLLELRSGLGALHQIQDEIARGISDGSQIQSAILERITGSLEQIPGDRLADHEHQFALAELGLSGGDRSRVTKLIEQTRGRGPLQPLLAGVHSYLKGELDTAAEEFEKAGIAENGGTRIDHFIALAKGTALLDSDLQKAREAFELAVLHAPGTLVEEVALRRLAGVSLKQKDAELFVRCANVYLRRYASSPFAGEFMTSFDDGMLLVTRPDDVVRLGNLATLVPAEKGRAMMSSATAGLLAKGEVGFARVFTEQLNELISSAARDPAENAELQLFNALSNIDGATSGETLETLQKLDGKMMGAQAKDLLEIARHAAWNVHRPLETFDAGQTTAGPQESGVANEFAEADQMLVQAKTVLERLDPAKVSNR